MTEPADDARANAGDAGPAEEPEAAPGDWLLAAAPPPQKSKKRKVLAHDPSTSTPFRPPPCTSGRSCIATR